MSIEIREIQAHQTHNLRHQVMWPDKPIDYVILSNDEEGQHFGLWKDSVLVSVVSLFINDTTAQFRKLATDTSVQGNGYASLLLEHLITVVTDQKIEKLWCNARADKTSFYKKFGMSKTTRTFVKGGIDYVIMEKSIVNLTNSSL